MIPLYLIFSISIIGLASACVVIVRGVLEDLEDGNFLTCFGGIFVFMCLLTAIGFAASNMIQILITLGVLKL